MEEPRFSGVVSLGCHDQRSPLATVSGFAKTLLRGEAPPERRSEFLGMIVAAADELSVLLDELSVVALIESGSYAPELGDADTLALASCADKRVSAAGTGETIQTDAAAIGRSLEALAVAAVRYGSLDRATWTVNGRDLRLEPVTAAAAPVVSAAEARDFGSLVARRVIEALGGSLSLDGESLVVRL